MTPILVTGTVIVNLALASYTIGIALEQRSHLVSNRVLQFLSLGVTLDFIATTCMIIGSTSSPFTLHGILGYSSLTAMTLDTALIWWHRRRRGAEQVSRALHLYSRFAYIWWVLAYVTGALLVLFRR